MTTYPHWLLANFGGSYSGQAANVRYTIRDNVNAVKATAIGTMTEEADDAGVVNTGSYGLLVPLDFTWLFPLKVKYTISGQAGVVAEDVIPLEVSNLLNLIIPATDLTDKTTQTVGECLSAARSDAVGDASVVGDMARMLGPNGETVRSFTLNNPNAPTART